jgi:hypothetical protein
MRVVDIRQETARVSWGSGLHETVEYAPRPEREPIPLPEVSEADLWDYHRAELVRELRCEP